MVDILLASYNGEKYIAQQIDSILSQTYSNWMLYINDDCSSDDTVKIIERYSKQYPDKIIYTVNDKNSGNAGTNFFNMIKKSKADIIMTCDQDDVWLNDKVENCVNALKGENEPTLVHTDLKLIDADNNIINDSMMKLQHINPHRNSTNKLIVQNTVTGCTMAFNRALADIIKIPKGQPVHDWYIAVVASLFGKIKFIDKADILYRQHSDNYCGAVDMENMDYISNRFKDKNKAKYMIELGYDMAEEIIRLYNIDNKMLNSYSSMKNYSKLKKLYIVFRYGIWKSGIIRKLGQIYFM